MVQRELASALCSQTDLLLSSAPLRLPAHETKTNRGQRGDKLDQILFDQHVKTKCKNQSVFQI